MKAEKTARGFIIVKHEKYASSPVEMTRLIQESSAIDFNYDDTLDNPGSSYLWIGDNHHLNREEVKELIGRLQYWLKNKRLEFK